MPLCTEKQACAAVYILTSLTKFTMFETVYVKYATEPTKTKMFNTFSKIRGKKEVLHSLAPPLTLTLTLSLNHSLDHLANKLLRKTSTPYGLIYLLAAQFS